MSIHDLTVETIGGSDRSLSDYKGKICLLVNVASECGLTPQYEGLQALHEKYSSMGLDILAFPANNFGAQEPGSNQQIQEFCTTKFSVRFELFSKISTSGEDQCELYKFLTSDESGFPGDISWNFEKFLIGRDGTVIQRFEPKTEPQSEELISAIENALT